MESHAAAGMATAAQGVPTMPSDSPMHETRILAWASVATDAHAIGEAMLLKISTGPAFVSHC
jgi:hypothetical protein